MLAQLGISLATAVTTAVLTVWLSLNRFYREKWWEARMSAYTALIRSLHQIKRHSKSALERAYRHETEDKTDFQRDLTNRSQQAWRDLNEYIDLGEFLIAPDALSVLRHFSEEMVWGEDEDPVDYYEKCDLAVDKCLPSLKEIARRDLKLTRRSFI